MEERGVDLQLGVYSFFRYCGTSSRTTTHGGRRTGPGSERLSRDQLNWGGLRSVAGTRRCFMPRTCSKPLWIAMLRHLRLEIRFPSPVTWVPTSRPLPLSLPPSTRHQQSPASASLQEKMRWRKMPTASNLRCIARSESGVATSYRRTANEVADSSNEISLPQSLPSSIAARCP